jgi:hypothetical protein
MVHHHHTMAPMVQPHSGFSFIVQLYHVKLFHHTIEGRVWPSSTITCSQWLWHTMDLSPWYTCTIAYCSTAQLSDWHGPPSPYHGLHSSTTQWIPSHSPSGPWHIVSPHNRLTTTVHHHYTTASMVQPHNEFHLIVQVDHGTLFHHTIDWLG